jgi:hypothetical protein
LFEMCFVHKLFIKPTQEIRWAPLHIAMQNLMTNTDTPSPPLSSSYSLAKHREKTACHHNSANSKFCCKPTML